MTLSIHAVSVSLCVLLCVLAERVAPAGAGLTGSGAPWRRMLGALHG